MFSGHSPALRSFQVTFVHMGEISLTASHKHYLMFIHGWVLCGTLACARLVGADQKTEEEWYLGMAFGTVVYFIFAAGVAKLYISANIFLLDGEAPDVRSGSAELSPSTGTDAWLTGKALKAILETRGKVSTKEGGACSPKLLAWVQSSPMALAVLATTTLIFELVLGPGYALLAAPAYRVVTGERLLAPSPVEFIANDYSSLTLFAIE